MHYITGTILAIQDRVVNRKKRKKKENNSKQHGSYFKLNGKKGNNKINV